MQKKYLLAATSLAVFALSGASVFAAEGDLEQITVTARKSQESILSVPLAVTAINANELAERGVVDPFMDVAKFTPGFTFQNQSVNRNDRGFKQFIVRGIIPGSANPYRSTASVFVDGTPVMGSNVSGITDIDRVEIVKGPQSAYFGRSTFAGAINFVTRAPGNEFGGTADINVAEWATTDINASVEGPIVKDKLAVRISGRSYHTGGQYTNIEEPQDTKLGERDTKSIAATIHFTPTDAFNVKVFVNTWTDEDGPSANAQLNNTYFNCNAGANPRTTLNYYCGEIKSAPEDTRVYNTVMSPAVYKYLTGQMGPGGWLFSPNFLTHIGLKRNATEAHASADYTLESGYILSANGAYDINKWAFINDTTFRNTQGIPNPNFGTAPDLLPYFFRSAAGPESDSDRSGELRLTSPTASSFRWMAGGNYVYERSDILTNAWGPTGYIAASALNYNISKTFGIFASASYDFAEVFTLTGEGRVQWDKVSQIQVKAGYSAEATTRSFTPRVILDYKPRRDLTLYASFSEGTRPGEFNTQFFTLTPAQQAAVTAQAAVGLAVPEERIRMGELGVKGMFFDDKLRVMADVYYGQWLNRHIPNSVNLTSATQGFIQTVVVISPGGLVNLRGLELESTWKPTRELTFEGTFNIAETDIRKTYCTDCLSTTGNASPVGTQLPYFPKYKGTLSATYERPVSGDISGYVRADWIYTGRIYDSEANVAWLAPNSKLNLHVGLERGNTRVELYGLNILDDRTPSALARNTDSYTGGNAVSLSLADKATYGLRVTTKF